MNWSDAIRGCDVLSMPENMISEEGELLGHVASMKKPYTNKIVDWLSE